MTTCNRTGKMGMYDRRDDPAYQAQRAAQGNAQGEGGDNKGTSKKAAESAKTEPMFEYTANTADACSESKLGLCVFAIVDGSPTNPDRWLYSPSCLPSSNHPTTRLLALAHIRVPACSSAAICKCTRACSCSSSSQHRTRMFTRFISTLKVSNF